MGGRRVWGRVDTWMVELSPFDVLLKLTALLTGYSPIQSKKLEKKIECSKV